MCSYALFVYPGNGCIMSYVVGVSCLGSVVICRSCPGMQSQDCNKVFHNILVQRRICHFKALYSCMQQFLSQIVFNQIQAHMVSLFAMFSILCYVPSWFCWCSAAPGIIPAVSQRHGISSQWLPGQNHSVQLSERLEYANQSKRFANLNIVSR